VRTHATRSPAAPATLPAARAASTAAASVDLVNGKRFNSPDSLIEENKLAPGAGDDKRAFTYFVLVRGTTCTREPRRHTQ